MENGESKKAIPLFVLELNWPWFVPLSIMGTVMPRSISSRNH